MGIFLSVGILFWLSWLIRKYHTFQYSIWHQRDFRLPSVTDPLLPVENPFGPPVVYDETSRRCETMPL